MKTLSWSAIGRKYSVSCNTIRKWARKYKLLSPSVKQKNIIKLKKLKEKLGCQICGVNESCCMDFHHLDVKNDSIANMINNGCNWIKIVDEISRCAALCANCHRKVHFDIITDELQNSEKLLHDIYPNWRYEFELGNNKVFICRFCGKESVGYKTKLYCSDDCSHKNELKISKEKRRNK